MSTVSVFIICIYRAKQIEDENQKMYMRLKNILTVSFLIVTIMIEQQVISEGEPWSNNSQLCL